MVSISNLYFCIIFRVECRNSLVQLLSGHWFKLILIPSAFVTPKETGKLAKDSFPALKVNESDKVYTYPHLPPFWNIFSLDNVLATLKLKNTQLPLLATVTELWELIAALVVRVSPTDCSNIASEISYFENVRFLLL